MFQKQREQVDRGKGSGYSKCLEPLAREMRKYRSYDELLPKRIRNSEIRDVVVFGSSVKGGTYHDIDVAVFLNTHDRAFKKYRMDIRRVGKLEYHIFRDDEEGRAIFDAMLEMKTETGKGIGVRIRSLEDFYRLLKSKPVQNPAQ